MGLWDEITPKIMTASGHEMQRKCMDIFGRKLCLCEFLNWVKFGTTKHQCGRKTVIVKKQKMKKKNKIIKLRKIKAAKRKISAQTAKKQLQKKKIIGKEKKIIAKKKKE